MTLSIVSCKKKNTLKQENKTAAINKVLDSADLIFDSNKKDSAYYYYDKALSMSDPEKNPNQYVYSLTCMAEILQIEGDYTTSEDILSKAMPYIKKTTRPRYPWYAYNVMANNYDYTYDYNNAVLYHKKSLQYTASNLKKRASLNNIASVYINQKKYAEAIKILLPLAAKKEVFGNDPKISKRDYSIVLDNLGHCYYSLNDPKALYYYTESLKIKTELNDEELIMISHKNLSNYYLKIDPKLAKKYAELSYAKSFKIRSILNRSRCLSLLINCSEGSDLKKYTLKYIELMDSISDARQRKKNQFALIRSVSKKDRDENLKLKTQQFENELQLERQKNRNIISYIIIIFIVGVLLFLSFYLSAKGKKQKTETITKSEMRISNKLHDELAIDVYNTFAFAESEDLELNENKEQLLNSLENIYNRTRNISKENSSIITNEKYADSLKDMIADFKTPNINILVNGIDTIPWNKIDKNKKITAYRIIQELFINMKKHSNASLVSAIFKIIDQNVVVICTDNGVGVPNGKIILKNGLQNVESRIETINGTINFDANSDKGFKVSFTFPL
ncbi:tetratricopeptide repeat protein [Flavobacterium sp. MC2016-06]|uniref:tetratricopeptide repeat-containing sensor histidine kinase n=1 Tax=Flavobacterium sp. MC2016-06 TaxID=2676308 RepID=UPI0018ACD4B1|nr:tetratricopeptide repeat-containing sensor histidine kinase [Flavobacterium sp. MC2016-06]MBU3861649.1 tetratricopeptide repeat protein [Flavobacterium sp. MC2016-06]